MSDCTPNSDPILILGGSGFIGTQLCSLLTERGIPFRIGDLRPSKAFPDHWAQCDVRHLESLREVNRNARAIVNLAAEHRDDVRPLALYHETNVKGAINVCQAAREAGVSRIIFTSSVAVYGFHSFAADEDCPFLPFNEYGKTKLDAEGIYRKWAAEDPSRSLVVVRPTVVFGEGNRANVYTLLRQVASRRFVMTGPGTNIKSMAYVLNVAAFLAHLLAIGTGVHTFNYADGPDMSTRELVEYIKRCLGENGRTPHIPISLALAGGHLLDGVARVTGRKFPISAIRVRKFCESTQFRAERALQTGFVPPYSLLQGLERTIRSEFSSTTKND
jgi:nucleoside-diphosphate-sugar epimerase